MIQLLERSLSRLALISQGLDPVLDKHLSTLRKLLRSNSLNPLKVEAVLKALEHAISQMKRLRINRVLAGIWSNRLSKLAGQKIRKKPRQRSVKKRLGKSSNKFQV